MSNQTRKTRSILINPKFQWTLIGYAAIVATLIFIAVYGLISYGFHDFVKIGNEAGLPSDHVFYQFIQMQETRFNGVILAIAMITGTILIVGGLIVSHKIAGPLHRIKNEFNKMADKDTPSLHKIHFRDGDYFPEVAEAFNTLVDKIKKSEDQS
jgi:hypothetical protein